jgi:hypothetical protein
VSALELNGFGQMTASAIFVAKCVMGGNTKVQRR